MVDLLLISNQFFWFLGYLFFLHNKSAIKATELIRGMGGCSKVVGF